MGIPRRRTAIIGVLAVAALLLTGAQAALSSPYAGVFTLLALRRVANLDVDD